MKLYDDLKKQSRLIQRNIRRIQRRKEGQRARSKFLKNPYEETKKLFVAQKSGNLECSKEELDDHVRETYRDEKRYDPLPTMNKLIPPPVPKISFRLGALTKKEVDDRV